MELIDKEFEGEIKEEANKYLNEEKVLSFLDKQYVSEIAKCFGLRGVILKATQGNIRLSALESTGEYIRCDDIETLGTTLLKDWVNEFLLQ